MPRPPSRGRFTDRYGPRRNPVTGRLEQHHGLDINAAAGRVLVAPETGTLTGYGIVPGWEAHGLVARLRDRDGWEHWLSHTDTLTAGRRIGDQLHEGDPVAYMGATGQTTGLHVHWETRDPHGNRLDPEAWLARPAGDGAPFTPLQPQEVQDMRVIKVTKNGATTYALVGTRFFQSTTDVAQANGWASVWGDAREVSQRGWEEALNTALL